MLMDETAVAAFIQQFSFGALVTADLNISHLPFLFQAQEGEKAVLYGHMARASGQHKLTSGGRVVVTFNGPTLMCHRLGIKISRQCPPGITRRCTVMASLN
jgi:predicted FMN-binding regulatory protein PaiB